VGCVVGATVGVSMGVAWAGAFVGVASGVTAGDSPHATSNKPRTSTSNAKNFFICPTLSVCFYDE
jgi:hypothetical protein